MQIKPEKFVIRGNILYLKQEFITALTMFEKEIRFIYDFNLNKVKQLGANFTFQALAAAPMHPAIIQYISAEIDYLIYEDRRNLIQHSSFDYSGEEINRYFLLINEEIKKQKKLSLDYIDQLILQAASFTVNFLARPGWSLTKLVFDKEDTIEVSEALQIINYIHYYEYLKNISGKYFRKKNLETISRAEFELLLENIDREVFEKYSEKLLDKVLFSMGDFFNTGSMHKTNIPLVALEMFLNEKKLENYIRRISDAFYPDPKGSYDITEIKKILYAAVPVKKDRYLDRVVKQNIPDSVFKSEPEKKEESTVEEPQQFEAKPESETVPENPIIEDDPVPDVPEDKTIKFRTEDTSQPEQEEKTNKVIETEVPIEIPEEHSEAISIEEDEKEHTLFDHFDENETIMLEIPEIVQKTREKENLSPVNSEFETDTTDDAPPEKKTDADHDIIIIDTSEKSELVSDSSSEIETDNAEKIRNEFGIDETNADEHYEIQIEDNNEELNIAADKVKNESLEEPVVPWSIKKERKDILSFMSGKEMNHIITNIFNEDTQDCAFTLEKIAESKDLDEAFTIYYKTLKSYRVNPKLKEAVLLKKVITEFFNQ